MLELMYPGVSNTLTPEDQAQPPAAVFGGGRLDARVGRGGKIKRLRHRVDATRLQKGSGSTQRATCLPVSSAQKEIFLHGKNEDLRRSVHTGTMPNASIVWP